MVPGTHLIISKIVYKHIIMNENFYLDWANFAYGSIRPDIDKKHIRCFHTIEDSLDMINSYSEKLIKSKISVKEFSEGLGIVCHFICDYFCMHHGKDYWKKDPLAHGVYEVYLHMKLLKIYAGGDINIVYRLRPEKSLKDIILKLQEKYNSQPKSIELDISYALIAAIAVSEFVVRSTKSIKNQQLLTNKHC